MTAVILGIASFTAVMTALLFYFQKSSGDEHLVLRLFLLFSITFSLFLLGKGVYDTRETCELVRNSTTVNTSQQNITEESYTYAKQCYTSDETTELLWMKWTSRLILFVSLYMFVFTIYKAWQYATEVVTKKP